MRIASTASNFKVSFVLDDANGAGGSGGGFLVFLSFHPRCKSGNSVGMVPLLTTCRACTADL